MRPFRLTLLFAITSAVVFAAAGAVVYFAFGRIAADSIVRSAERETERALSHLLAETVARVVDPADPSLELEALAVPEGLPHAFAHAAPNLNFVAAVLYASNGAVVWTTAPHREGPVTQQSSVVTIANVGGTTPWLAGAPEFLDVGGALRRFDAVSSYVPVRSAPYGPVIGILQAHRDITDDLALQSAQGNSAVVRATAATMAGLFTALLGFVFVAERAQARSGRRDLAESEARARQVVETVPGAVITFDAAGVVIAWNPRAEAVLGWPAGEAVGRSIDDMFVPSEAVKRLCTVPSEFPASASGPAAARHVDVAGRHRDGRLIPVELCLTPTPADGDTACTVFLRDITERRQIEDGLRKTAFENATLAEIGRAASDSLDVREMLCSLAARIKELFPADRIAFGMVDRDGGTITLEHVSGIEVTGLGLGAVVPLPHNAVEESVRTGRPVLIDAAAMEARGLEDRATAAALSAGVRSELIVAITRDGNPFASLALASTSPDAFAQRDVLLAERLAVQLSAPIANAVLHGSAGHEAGERGTLAEIGRIVGSSLDVDAVFDLVGEQVKKLVTFDWISISIVDLESGTARVACVQGRDLPDAPRVESVPLAGSVTEAMAGARSGLVLGRETPETLEKRFPATAPFVRGRARSSVSALLIAGEEVIGALHLMSARPDAYSPGDLRVVERIAAEIAAAVKNATVHGELRRELHEREVLADVTHLVGSSMEVDESLELLAERLGALFTFDALVINTVDLDRGVLRDRRVAGSGATRVDWGVEEPLAGTLTGRAIDDRAGFIASVDFPEQIAGLFPGSTDELESSARSFLTTPLVFNEAVIGALQLRAHDPDAFSEEDLRRAEQVAGQIVGAVASAGLHGELVREAAEREALAEMGRIVSSTLDVNTVYDEFADQVRRLIRFDSLGIYVAEGNRNTLAARYVAGVDLRGIGPGSTLSLGPLTIAELFPGKLGRILDREPFHLFARQTDDAAGDPARELPSAMAVPLVSGDEVIGILELRSGERNAYSERHLALAERVAAQIAGAISNADLHSRIQRESGARAVLAEIGRIIGSSPDIGDVYERFAEQVRRLVAFDGIAVSTLDPAGQTITNAYLAGVDVGGMAPGFACPASETAVGRVALSGKSRLERVRDANTMGGPSERRAAKGDSQIIIPLASEGRPVGALTLSAKGRDLYTERDVDLAEQVAVQIAGGVAQSQLHAELRLLGTALEAAADLIVITDRDGTIEYVNEAFARQTGYAKDEAVGRNPRLLKSGHQDPAYYKDLWDTILAGKVWEGNLINRRRDGSEYREEMTITPVRGDDGEIARFIAIKRDITDRVRAEQERETLRQLDTENRELQRVNEARSRFVSTVSHELRTPLTSMLAFADILAKNIPQNLQPRQAEQIEAIQRGGALLQVLINDLLDVSRIDSGRFRLEETEFDARQLLEEVVRGFGPILAGKRQTLETSIPSLPLRVYADRERVSQVVSNLLSNASKYSPDESTIELEVRTHGNRLCVRVRDFGIGISEEDQRKLFTPFFRADNEETRSASGTGLGLVIAKSIVEMHGGQMSLESEWGVGTAFRFSVPRLLDDSPEPAPVPPV